MKIATLVGLLDSCVCDFASDGIEELVCQLHEMLPDLLRSTDEDDFELLVRAARLIAFSQKPAPATHCVSVLLDIGFAHFTRARTSQAIPLVERALDIATDNDLRPEMRRACSIFAGLCADLGNPARGVEYALRAAMLAHELNNPLGKAAAFANMTASLFAMGLYRETVSLALRVIKKFKGDEAYAELVFVARSNLAGAAFALQHFTLSAEVAKEACDQLGTPRSSHEAFNLMATEIIWLKSAIELNDTASIGARLSEIRALTDAHPSLRLRLNATLAEAAFELHHGRTAEALEKLHATLKMSRTIPGIYRDNLSLLIRAYESEGDYTKALVHLGELVEFIAETQVTAVGRVLEAIDARVQTPLRGKDDGRSVIMAIQRRPLSGVRSDAPHESVYRDALERLAVSADVRDETRGGHTYRVGKLAGLLSAEMGYGASKSDEVEQAARLHDIGKLGIPDGILVKQARLTSAEFALMQRHTTIGAQILRQASHPSFRLAEQVALHHHERWDGSGYPTGLAGDLIPEVARMVALVDTYDALTHVRTYKPAWSHDAAVTELARLAGVYFDPMMARVFVALVDRLRETHGEGLDDFLAAAGNDTSFIQARDTLVDILSDVEPLAAGELL